MKNLTDDVRSQIAEKLPGVLKKALEDYEKFLEAPEKEASKEFKERHDACKAAIAHIAMIVKTAEQFADRSAACGEGQQKYLEALLIEARKEIENQ